jgi:hypothetical protein
MYMNNRSTADPVRALEMSEIIEKLKENGHTKLVECLLDHESDCYTKKGRLNKSATTRQMGWKSKQLEDALKEMRELLGDEFGEEEEEEN